MRFFRPKKQRLVTLYGKPGCHLCEDARDMLHRLASRYPMRVEEIDISQDPGLFRKYDVVIPVIVIDGEATLEAPIDARKLRDALAGR